MLDLTSVEEVAKSGTSALRERLLPPDTALLTLPEIHIDAAEAAQFCAGQAVRVTEPEGDGLLRVYGGDNEFLGVGEVSGDGWVAPRRVFRVNRESPVDI